MKFGSLCALLAAVSTANGVTSWSDFEGNVLLKLPAPGGPAAGKEAGTPAKDGSAREAPAKKAPARP